MASPEANRTSKPPRSLIWRRGMGTPVWPPLKSQAAPGRIALAPAFSRPTRVSQAGIYTVFTSAKHGVHGPPGKQGQLSAKLLEGCDDRRSNDDSTCLM